MVTDEMIETALIKWFNEISWDKGMAPWAAEQFRAEMRATLEAALSANAHPEKSTMTDAEILQWVDACNHEPARETLRHYLTLRADLSAQVPAE